jgi:hypothetical protein
VTWDPSAPKGCHAHGFKSTETPSQLVFASSGIHCQLYSPRAGKDASTQENGLDDPLNPKDTFERRRS